MCENRVMNNNQDVNSMDEIFNAGAYARKNDVALEETLVAKLNANTAEYKTFMDGYDSEVSDTCEYKTEFRDIKKLLREARQENTVKAKASVVAFFFRYRLVKKIEVTPQYVGLSEKDMRECLIQEDGSQVVSAVVAMANDDPELSEAMKDELGEKVFRQWLFTHEAVKDHAPHLMPA